MNDEIELDVVYQRSFEEAIMSKHACLSGLRVSSYSTQVSFNVPSYKATLVYYSFQGSSICRFWYYGTVKIEGLPDSCRRSEMWKALHDYSRDGTNSNVLIEFDSWKKGRLKLEAFVQCAAGAEGRYFAKATLEDVDGDFWIVLNSQDDLEDFRKTLFLCADTYLLLTFWVRYGWYNWANSFR